VGVRRISHTISRPPPNTDIPVTPVRLGVCAHRERTRGHADSAVGHEGGTALTLRDSSRLTGSSRYDTVRAPIRRMRHEIADTKAQRGDKAIAEQAPAKADTLEDRECLELGGRPAQLEPLPPRVPPVDDLRPRLQRSSPGCASVASAGRRRWRARAASCLDGRGFGQAVSVHRVAFGAVSLALVC